MLSLAILAACSSAVDPLNVPSARAVSMIEGSSYRSGFTITDQDRIRRVMAFLSGMSGGMSIPDGTFPEPTHTIVVTDNTGVNLVVFVGKDWMGGRNNVGGRLARNRLRSITAEQRGDLLRLVGLRDSYP
jgi:hypothetical protein